MRTALLLVLAASPFAAHAADTDGMLLVPGGSFTMGGDGGEREKPHKVSLSPFWMDRTEVTQKGYQACVAAGTCSLPHGPFDPAKRPQLPVTSVDWTQARTYCAWVHKRLPTEAEWEFAARGNDDRKFPWGPLADCHAANYGNGTVVHTCDTVNPGEPTAVATRARDKSPFGVLDLGGNVSEWLSDWSDDAFYATSPEQDPVGPKAGVRRGVRGGSWRTDEAFARVSARNGARPDYTDDDLGFRCVQPRPCQAPEYRQMDFWIGEWKVQSSGKPAGVNSVIAILDGCALAERWTGADKWEGTSYNAYDAASGKWHQQWVDSRGTVLHFAGQMKEGSMVLEGDSAGTRQRVTYTPKPPTSMRQLHEISSDLGKTWRTVFDGTYTRAK